MQNGAVEYAVEYHDLLKAVEEAFRRLKNADLQSLVREIFDQADISLPPPLTWETPGPIIALLRHLPSARLEEIQFKLRLEELQSTGLQFEGVVLTYGEDRFTPENPSKKRLTILRGYYGRGKKGGVKEVGPLKIVDFNLNVGRPLSEVKTLSGKLLVDFHRETFQRLVGLSTFDISAWLVEVGGVNSKKAKGYYPYLFLLAASGRLIIFESFESPGFPSLEVFNNEVVIPAWRKAQEHLGLSPLIVYHPQTPDPVSGEKDEEVILNYYPPEVITYAVEGGWV